MDIISKYNFYKYHNLLKHTRYFEKTSKDKYLHSYDTIIIVACNMEPCTWIDKSGIPTLQNIIRII